MSCRTSSSLAAAVATLSAMILVGGGAAGCARHRGPPAARVARTTSTTRALQTAPVIVQPAPTAVGGGPSGDEVRAEGPQRLDAARVERSIEARKDRLRNECFAPEEGVVSFIIDLQVAPDGRVERAKTRSVDGSHDVAECVRARLEKTSFPPSVEGGTHSVTFHFGR